ncbi:hypothetical protein EAM_1502 [Erwinia amylovora ATCC 49946]|nr:hypothetical protein EAM_1502 [Erwinia amylovora ATCC 49946]
MDGHLAIEQLYFLLCECVRNFRYRLLTSIYSDSQVQILIISLVDFATGR